jgi:hypothetical protein
MWPPLTIHECDERLTACCEAFKQAVEAGDELTADAMRDTMDELLDRRARIPQARPGT